MSHVYDPYSDYCTRCGRGADWVVEHSQEKVCDAPPNLVAISHLIARRRQAELVGLFKMEPYA